MTTGSYFENGMFVFEHDLNYIRNYISGYGIKRGFDLSVSSGYPVINVDSGSIIINGNIRDFSSTNITFSSDPSNPKKALIYATTNSITYSEGTPEAAVPQSAIGKDSSRPVPPSLSSEHLPIAEVWIPANSDYSNEYTIFEYSKILDYKKDETGIVRESYVLDNLESDTWTKTSASYSEDEGIYDRQCYVLTSINGATASIEKEVDLDLSDKFVIFNTLTPDGSKIANAFIVFEVDNNSDKYFTYPDTSSSPSFFIPWDSPATYDNNFWRRQGAARGYTYRHNVTDDDWNNITKIKYVLVSDPSVTASVKIDKTEIYKALKSGFVTFTQDDNLISETYLKYFNKMGWKKTACINITGATNYTPYRKLGGEIISHGYNHRYAYDYDEGDMTLINDMILGKSDILSKNGGSGARFYAYPGGAYFGWVVDYIRKSKIFCAARRTGGGGNTFPPGDWLVLNAMNAEGAASIDGLDRAMKFGEWYIVYDHGGTYSWNLMERCKEKGYPIVSFGEVYDVIRPSTMGEMYAYNQGHEYYSVPTKKQPSVIINENYLNVSASSTNAILDSEQGFVIPETFSYGLQKSDSSYTDYSTELSNTNSDDVPLLRNDYEDGDSFYFGLGTETAPEHHTFSYISTQRVNRTTSYATYSIYSEEPIILYYWNTGGSWSQLTTMSFYSGTNTKTFSAPSDWTTSNIDGKDAYWLRAQDKGYWKTRGTVSAFLQYRALDTTYYDFTTEANNDTTDDVTWSKDGEYGDIIYIGYYEPFFGVSINVSTPDIFYGKGATFSYKYWDGDSWNPITPKHNSLTYISFEDAGVKEVFYFNDENIADWDTTTVNGVGPYYWIQIEQAATHDYDCLLSRAKIGAWTDSSYSIPTLSIAKFGNFLTAEYKTISSFDGQPDHPRVLVFTGTQNNAYTATLQLEGYSVNYDYISESITLPYNVSTESYYPYHSVSKILLDSNMTSEDSLSVGYINKYGLSNRIEFQPLYVRKNGATVSYDCPLIRQYISVSTVASDTLSFKYVTYPTLMED